MIRCAVLPLALHVVAVAAEGNVGSGNKESAFVVSVKGLLLVCNGNENAASYTDGRVVSAFRLCFCDRGIVKVDGRRNIPLEITEQKSRRLQDIQKKKQTPMENGNLFLYFQSELLSVRVQPVTYK